MPTRLLGKIAEKQISPTLGADWTLSTFIEKVILDNEEKSTTYTETGDTGILLGTISLPAPKNHLIPMFLANFSMEVKTDTDGVLVFRTYIFDNGTQVLWTDGGWDQGWGISGTYRCINWFYVSSVDVNASSHRGSTQLEFRIYLKGDSVTPDNRVYCRNLVVTVVPLYKT